MKTLVVLQPGYLPWLGFFDQMHRCDVFVYYDDVQFDKHGWRNRNRIKTADGIQWLTVPVLHKGRGKQRVCEVGIDNRQPWGRKHIRALRQAYAAAPYLNLYLPEFEALLSRRWEHIADLDIAVTAAICRWLGLERRIFRSSELDIDGDRSARLLSLCLYFGAERYLSGDAAKSYLEVDLFNRNGVAVEWHDYHCPAYPQLHGAFVPNLSIIDLLLNVGGDSLMILTSR